MNHKYIVQVRIASEENNTFTMGTIAKFSSYEEAELLLNNVLLKYQKPGVLK